MRHVLVVRPLGHLGVGQEHQRAELVAMLGEDRHVEVREGNDQLDAVLGDGCGESGYVARVVDAGYEAICLTVDLQVFGLRHRDARHGFDTPIGGPSSALVYDDMLSWDDVAWVRERTPNLPLLVKGILTAEDAELAVSAGVDGIVVSNHGGRQLDGAPAGLTVLPEVVDAVAGRVPVLVDGGIRRGTDVMKALALGADAVLAARPFVWGLAVDGEAGVVDVLRILREEFENTMALCGCRTVAEITSALVTPA